MNKKKVLYTILGVLVLGLVVWGGYKIFAKELKKGYNTLADKASSVISHKQEEPVQPASVATSTPLYSSDMATWATYSNVNLGISLKYPRGMEVHEFRNKIIIATPGIADGENTNLSDGLHLTIFRDSYPISYNDYAARDYQEAQNVGVITRQMSSSTIASRSAQKYTVHTFADVTRQFVQYGTSEVIGVSYAAPDPGQQGYQAIADMIVSSLQFPTLHK